MRVDRILLFTACITTLFTLTGCWVAAAGVGAEAGYVASQEDRTTGQTLDDQGITASIKTKLLTDSEVSGLDINVDTFKSHVTLKGIVKTAYEADKALKIAQNTTGVKSVTSKLMVQ